MNSLQNEINKSCLSQCQREQLLNLLTTLLSANVNDGGAPSCTSCPIGVDEVQSPPGQASVIGPICTQGPPVNVPGGVPIVVNYNQGQGNSHVACGSQVASNTKVLNPSAPVPTTSVPITVTNPPTNTQKVFIKTTTFCDNKVATPPSATNTNATNSTNATNANAKVNTTKVNNQKLIVNNKQAELYITYLEREVERQRKFIKEAYLNPDIKK